MKPTRETRRHIEAFEFYYGLGQPRSLEQVARKFSVTPTAAAGWSSAFAWANRIRERDREVGARIVERNKSDIVKMTERHLRVTRAIQGNFVTGLQAGTVSVTPKDFLAAASYEGQMLGYSPDGGNASAVDVGEVLRMLLYVLHTTLPDACPSCRAASDVKQRVSAELMRLASRYATAEGSEQTKPAHQTEQSSASKSDAAIFSDGRFSGVNLTPPVSPTNDSAVSKRTPPISPINDSAASKRTPPASPTGEPDASKPKPP